MDSKAITRATRSVLAVIALCLVSFFSAAADLPVVKVGVLKFGTINWEMDVIKRYKLDEKNGFDLEVIPLAAKNASSVALQGGAVDVIFSDWVWVSRQRAAGKTYTLSPTSATAGGLFAAAEIEMSSPCDLDGAELGIAGGSVDKTWLMYQAYCKATENRDISAITEQQFVAPPLLNKLMMQQKLPVGINFWHYGARLKAAGFKPVISLDEIVSGLGIDAQVPMLGWVFDEKWAEENPKLVSAFLNTSDQARQILQTSDEEWDIIRPLTKAENDAVFEALRSAYRSGFSGTFGAEQLNAATQIFDILAKEGGPKLVGKSSTLSDGTFWMPQ
ncbi:ABC transporter substrate-binding protein [Enterovibrio paralichthyis]|uniref:ABC transporter substrate-binding protein n=1 Tax=Enterovibrio paralichthyis TaxID=2853805 RepID=UPI001C486343|nr:ABC transporter substrate-binding protein [Enterovibrio paralichthyis]MBV7298197.1 ABC transporter substrate-binding protein [Enterovibrio paralichthyis]